MAIKKVNSIQDFILNAMKDIDIYSKDALITMANEASEVLRKLTAQWYSSHTPTTYDRTYEFINSITVDRPVFSNEGWSIGVYFDPNKMSLGVNNLWNQHESRFNLSEIIEEGWFAGTKWIEGSEAILNTAEWAEVGNFARIVKQELTRVGFRVK